MIISSKKPKPMAFSEEEMARYGDKWIK